jgi:hypothetical protein
MIFDISMPKSYIPCTLMQCNVSYLPQFEQVRTPKADITPELERVDAGPAAQEIGADVSVFALYTFSFCLIQYGGTTEAKSWFIGLCCG